jgi:NAD(P)H dehydrogenase (quinone)
MKTLIVSAHPNPFSFNAAVRGVLADSLAKAGHEVRHSELYETGFGATLTGQELLDSFQGGETPLDVKAEQEKISWADAICFIYPTWWMNMPAVMKGYIDRVFAFNFAYAYGERGLVALLQGKQGLVIQTAGRSERNLKERGLERAMRLIAKEGIMDAGIDIVEHLFLYAVNTADETERAAMLQQVAELTGKLDGRQTSERLIQA